MTRGVNFQWAGPKDAYRSLEGALGAALRVSEGAGGQGCDVYSLPGAGGFLVVQDVTPEGVVEGRAVLVARVSSVVPLGNLRAK